MRDSESLYSTMAAASAAWDAHHGKGYTMTPFELAQAFILRPSIEGGFVIDDGGPTMHGVRQVVYDKYRASVGLPLQSVELIAPAEVSAIMRQEYWRPAHCASMPTDLAICQFDAAYNMGVEEAIKILQRALPVPIDGQYGEETARVLANCIALEQPRAPHGLAQRYLDARVTVYHLIVAAKPEEAQYLDTWLRRVADLRTYIGGLPT